MSQITMDSVAPLDLLDRKMNSETDFLKDYAVYSVNVASCESESLEKNGFRLVHDVKNDNLTSLSLYCEIKVQNYIDKESEDSSFSTDSLSVREEGTKSCEEVVGCRDNDVNKNAHSHRNARAKYSPITFEKDTLNERCASVTTSNDVRTDRADATRGGCSPIVFEKDWDDTRASVTPNSDVTRPTTSSLGNDRSCQTATRARSSVLLSDVIRADAEMGSLTPLMDEHVYDVIAPCQETFAVMNDRWAAVAVSPPCYPPREWLVLQQPPPPPRDEPCVSERPSQCGNVETGWYNLFAPDGSLELANNTWDRMNKPVQFEHGLSCEVNRSEHREWCESIHDRNAGPSEQNRYKSGGFFEQNRYESSRFFEQNRVAFMANRTTVKSMLGKRKFSDASFDLIPNEYEDESPPKKMKISVPNERLLSEECQGPRVNRELFDNFEPNRERNMSNDSGYFSENTFFPKVHPMPSFLPYESENFVSEAYPSAGNGNAIPFVSDDPEENNDNNDPEWEYLHRLNTDDERYKAVRQRWRNVSIPNPNCNLTKHNYRKRLAEANLCDETPNYFKNRKRLLAQNGPPNPKRFRNESEHGFKAFEFRVSNIRMNYELERKALITKHRNQKNNVGRSDQTAIAETQGKELRLLSDKFSVEIQKLMSSRDELLAFQSFYCGLRNSDNDISMLLDDGQLLDIQETDRMYSMYLSYYR